MRLATKLLAALALSSLIAPTIAAACGGDYGPRAPAMFLVAQHHGRTFVLLGGHVPNKEKLTWWTDDMSYDRSGIAVAPAFDTAREITLVGPTKSKKLATKNQVFITPVFESRNAMTALEIFPRGEAPFRIAIDGKHETKWAELTTLEASDADRAWAQNPGFSPGLDSSYLYVSKVNGTDLEVLSGFSASSSGLVTYVRTAGGKPWGGYAGTPHGVVVVDGVRYLVLVSEGMVTPVRV